MVFHIQKSVVQGGVLIDKVNVTMVTKLLEFIHPHNMNVALVTSKFPEGPQKYERYRGAKKGSEKRWFVNVMIILII